MVYFFYAVSFTYAIILLCVLVDTPVFLSREDYGASGELLHVRFISSI